MAIIKSKAITGQKPIVLPDDATAEWTSIDIEFPATAYAVGDLHEAFDLPIGFRCLDWMLQFPKIDSGGTTLAWSLGVENAGATDLGAEVWGTALAAGAAGATVRSATPACAQGDSTVQRRITLKCTAAATTYNGSGKAGQLLVLLQGW